MLTFSITHWRAWAPGLQDLSAWRVWAQSPFTPESSEMPQARFLPPMQRRRLSPMARMALECAWPIVTNHTPMPVVYASRHGETTRGYDLLHTLASGESLSPMSFGLSVHNAILGQWSILRKETAESTALSVEGDGAEHALLEACALQAKGHEHVLVILTEEAPPDAYQRWIDDVPFPYAAAFVISPGEQIRLELAPADAMSSPPELPSPLNFVRHLSLESSHWHYQANQRLWTWTRQH